MANNRTLNSDGFPGGPVVKSPWWPRGKESPGGPVVKNLLASAGDERDMGLIPGSGRSPGGGHGNPLQYSCLGNPMDGGAWWATIHRVTMSRT